MGDVSLLPKPCPECGAAVRVPSFRLWNGRCPNCHVGLSTAAAAEDARRPLATDKDVAAFLHFLGPLSSIRRWDPMTKRGALLFFLGQLLFAVAIASGWVEVSFGVAGWIFMVISFIVLFGVEFNLLCPRCKQPFRYATRFIDRLRTSPHPPDACVNCGLRALSDIDIHRWERQRPKQTGLRAWSEYESEYESGREPFTPTSASKGG